MDLLTLLKKCKSQSPEMSSLNHEVKSSALLEFAQLLKQNSDDLLRENKKDLTEQKDKLTPSLYQRLELSSEKIKHIVKGIEDLSKLDDPCNQNIFERALDEGLILKKVSTSIGVIAVIFESRPDVIPQVLSLMLKSGNVCLLKGGSEAKNTNLAFMGLVKKIKTKLPTHWATLLQSREEISEILTHDHLIDLVIPRGSNEMVQNIMGQTKIPVLGHADGVCHIYIDKSFDLKMALKIIIDSKCQYPSACNATEAILIHESCVNNLLPQLLEQLKLNSVSVFGCEKIISLYPRLQKVTNWHTEYSDLKVSLKIVNSCASAIDHINQFGSHHSDCIISNDLETINLFKQLVDSSSVMTNASTRFADGYRYGFGAEVGISTNKTHARGPVGIEGLVIYKFELSGQGHIVEDYSGPHAKNFQHKDL